MRLAIAALVVASLAPCAFATTNKYVPQDDAARAIPAPKENRIVRYTYSPDVIFRIMTLPNLHTHIELGDDEGVKETPTIGDSAQWRVSGGPRNLYVKPLRNELETSLTIVSNKRTYQFQLISGSKSESQVFQKVSFIYPERELEVKLRKEEGVAVVEAEQNRLSSQVISRDVDPAALDFGYEIKGNAPFRPTAAYTDGKFTFLPMPNTQDAPAIFLLDEEGKPSLINYQVKDRMIVVERMANRLLLKLGDAEVRVLRKTPKVDPSW